MKAEEKIQMMRLRGFKGFIELQRARHRQATSLGMQRARAEGKSIGRPLKFHRGPFRDLMGHDVVALHNKGETFRQIAAFLAISPATACLAYHKHKNENG